MEATTYIDAQVQDVEGTRVGFVVAGDLQLTGREHGHEQIGQVQHGRAEDLLRDIKGPHFQGPLRAFPPPLVD